MNAPEILIALDLCSSTCKDRTCSDCPYHNKGLGDSCVDIVCRDAINLINELRAEVERLQNEIILKNAALITIKKVHAAGDELVDQIVKEATT